jgi:hypothetical protein
MVCARVHVGATARLLCTAADPCQSTPCGAAGRDPTTRQRLIVLIAIYYIVLRRGDYLSRWIVFNRHGHPVSRVSAVRKRRGRQGLSGPACGDGRSRGAVLVVRVRVSVRCWAIVRALRSQKRSGCQPDCTLEGHVAAADCSWPSACTSLCQNSSLRSMPCGIQPLNTITTPPAKSKHSGPMLKLKCPCLCSEGAQPSTILRPY